MQAKLLIEKKRNGESLSNEEINFLIENFVSGDIPDYQFSALLMAIYFRGMNKSEIFALTEAMLNSGKRVNLRHLPVPPIDKHSTGGVGDKVSLILAPLVAAAGVPVPMMSGRGLGHSGGTLDKLESIPNFRTALSLDEFVEELEKINVAMIGQTDEIVPADRKIYALRDSTATVQSLPLIVSSIMSKKIAEGAQGLVLDVKTGRGAFLSELDESLELAINLISVGKKFGVRTTAYVTAMDQPLGNAVGNWLETKEAIDALKGDSPADLLEVTLTLSAEMVVLAGIESNFQSAKKKLIQLLESGKALEKFIELTAYQGGDVSVIEKPEKYPASKHRYAYRSQKKGVITKIDAYKIGMLSNQLGAGRNKVTDIIDPTAGIVFFKKEGDEVGKNDAIAELHYSKQMDESFLQRLMDDAIEVAEDEQRFEAKKLIIKYVSENGEIAEPDLS